MNLDYTKIRIKNLKHQKNVIRFLRNKGYNNPNFDNWDLKGAFYIYNKNKISHTEIDLSISEKYFSWHPHKEIYLLDKSINKRIIIKTMKI